MWRRLSSVILFSVGPKTNRQTESCIIALGLDTGRTFPDSKQERLELRDRDVEEQIVDCLRTFDGGTFDSCAANTTSDRGGNRGCYAMHHMRANKHVFLSRELISWRLRP